MVVDHGDGGANLWHTVVSDCEPVVEVPGQIRRQLRRVLDDWELDEDVTGDALLVVEELVANVVDHAHTRFRLHVRLDAGLLHVAVHDDLPGQVHVPAPDPERLRGQGLRIVDGLSRRWGCDPDDTGKTVWAELDT